jgi:hypothetical protein
MMTQTLATPYRTEPRPHADRGILATAALAACKAAILPLLAAAGITLVKIEYDGGGDEGQVHEISAFTADGKAANLPSVECDQHQLNFDGSVTIDTVDLSDALTNLAESALEALYDGWENGEGAFGEVVIDVANGTVLLEHNTRFVSHDTAHHTL